MKFRTRIIKIAWLAMGLALPFTNQAQETEGLRLDEIIEIKRAEYKLQGLDEEKIEKKIGQFQAYWNPRLAEGGIQGRMTAVFPKSGEEKSAGVFCETDFANWTLEGPLSYSGPNVGGHKQWNGLMTEVYPARDESFVLAAAERGGIWRRATGDLGWTNVTDAMNLPFMAFSSIVASPFDQNVIFAASGGESGSTGIIKSTDGGLTWSVLTNFQTDYCAAFPGDCAGGNESFINVQNLVVDKYNSTDAANIHLYALTSTDGDNSDIWRSTNSGLSWIQLRDPSLTFPAPTLPTHHSWVGVRIDEFGNLYCSTNYKYGADARFWKFDPTIGWVDLTSNINISTGSNLAIGFSTPQGSTIYAIRETFSPSATIILESGDGGISWVETTTLSGSSGGGREFEYYPETGLIYVGGVGLTSVDPNTSIETTISQGHVDLRDLYLAGSPDNYYLYTANDGGISKVDLSGSSWEDLSGNNLPVLSFSEIGVANTSASQYIGGVGHNNAKALNNGVWRHFSGGDGDAGVIHPTNPNLGYVVSSNSAVFKYNFLTNSESNTSVSSSLVGGSWFNAHIEIHPKQTNLVYYTNAKGSDGVNRLGVYNEITAAWTYHELLPDMIRPGEIGLGQNNAARVYVANFESVHDETDLFGLIRSDNWGITGSWTNIGFGDVYDATGTTVISSLNDALAWRYITDIEVNPNDANNLWITISGFMTDDEKNRVLVSYDGGDSWREFSQGLSRYPVHSIVYIPNTNGLLFVGTESGVFYRDNSMSEWTCYNSGMPYCVTSDLDYNTCTGELVAATYGRGIWKSTIPHHELPLTFTTNTTIPLGSYEFNTDIVIKAPAIFTVFGTIEMANDRRITVEPGATLIVDGGKITNQCDYLWQGIFLGGDITQPQLSDAYVTDPNQATLFLKNNGTIEHCGGVTTQAYHAGFNHGGRIFSTDGNFVDNRNDVILLSYPNNNVSYFRNTNFLTTGPLGDPDYIDGYGRELGAQVHVNMWEVNGVEFDENIFANSGTFDQDIRGTGILSIDSETKVNGLCYYLEGDGSCGDAELSFDNLSVGIDFRSSTSSHDLRVTLNKFEHTVQNITVTGANDVFIYDNHFLNYNGSDALGGIDFMKSWGIYLTNTRKVNVLDNYFADGISNSPVNLNYFTRGVILNNTGNTITNIRKNTFQEGEMIGLHAWGNNDGTQTFCNNFSSQYGIYVDRPKIGVSTFPTQGSSENPVGNSFFYSCSDNTHHIYFDGIDPISPWETVLDYHSFVGYPFLPVCISDDWSTLSYANPSNLSPGYVRTFESQNYQEGDCDLLQEIPNDDEVKNRKTLSNREEILTRELYELECSFNNSNQLMEALILNKWLVMTPTNDVFPGEKHSELSNLRGQLLEIDRNLGYRIQQLVLEGNVDQALEYISNDDSLSKLVYFNACMKMDMDLAFNLDELPTEYVAFYGLLLDIKKAGRSIFEMTASELEKLNTIAHNETPASAQASALLAFIDSKPFHPYVDDIEENKYEKLHLNKGNQEAIQVFPNPSSNLVTVQIDANFNAVGLEIFNMLGEIVYTTTPQTRQEIDVSNWESGVYIVSIISQNENQIVRFVVH